MKILQINKFYYLKGGSERHLFELSKLLEGRGHEVIPFSMEDPRNVSTPFARYFAKPVDFDHFSFTAAFKLFNKMDSRRRLNRLIKKEKPDIAHLHNIAHQLTPSIIRVLKKHGIPVVMTLHDYQPICPNYQLYAKGKQCERCKGGKYYQCVQNRCVKDSYAKSLMSAIETYLHRRLFKNYDLIDHFIAPSRFMAEVSAAFGLPKEKISVLYNFLGEEQRTGLENQATGGSDDYLLYFGRLTEEKGISDLLKALPEGTSLKIVGTGPEKDLLEEESAKSAGRVEFLGHQEGAALNGLVKRAKAVVLPARWPENMPYSLIESLAAGRPLLVSRIGGLTELVSLGLNGFTFIPGSHESIREAIQKLQAADWQGMSNASKEKSREFDSGQYYEKISEIYKSLLNKKQLTLNKNQRISLETIDKILIL